MNKQRAIRQANTHINTHEKKEKKKKTRKKNTKILRGSSVTSDIIDDFHFPYISNIFQMFPNKHLITS